ncbi:MAG TPA: hypothetical protein VKD65_05010 [Candidatus Angelobacter sp.]|nr:hypothetical protein [Candidatus Angelobacter sp.]
MRAEVDSQIGGLVIAFWTTSEFFHGGLAQIGIIRASDPAFKQILGRAGKRRREQELASDG